MQSNPEERWKGHQTAILRGAGCPALGDAIRKYGVQQFTFEVLIICFDEDRFHYEREYIKKFNAVVPNGYNILEGGEGGGFKGKRHTEETKEVLRKKVKERYEDGKERQISRDRALKQMAEIKRSGIDWGSKVKGSEKFKKAIEEGRVGGTAHSEDGHLKTGTKEKISESLKTYYKKATDADKEKNIKIHRIAMAKAVGIRVQQYTKEGVFINSYISIHEAARENKMYKSAIQSVMDKPNRTAGGFVWKRENVISHVEA